MNVIFIKRKKIKYQKNFLGLQQRNILQVGLMVCNEKNM